MYIKVTKDNKVIEKIPCSEFNLGNQISMIKSKGRWLSC